MSNDLTTRDELHTVAVFARGSTGTRVHVDGLGGTRHEATETALEIVELLGTTPRENLLTKVVATTPITELSIVPTSPESN
jgi:hypothetical protein